MPVNDKSSTDCNSSSDSFLSYDQTDYVMTIPSTQFNVPSSSQLNIPTETDIVSWQEKRHVSSARETKCLQGRGIQQIREILNDQKVSSVVGHPSTLRQTMEPKVYGFNHHYQYMNLWGATCPIVHQQNGISINPSILHQSNSELGDSFGVAPVGMNSVFKLPTTCKRTSHNPVAVLKIDLSKYAFEKRQCDKPIWPQPNAKKIGIKNFAHHIFTSPPLVNRLRDDGILPMVTFPKPKGESLTIPFGPYLDENRNPIAPGTCLPSSAVYRRYGMSLHASQNEAWRSNPDTVAAIIVRSPEKNCLPLVPSSNCLPDDTNPTDSQDYHDIISLSPTPQQLNDVQPRSVFLR
jgi:hypothetical protein